MPAVTWDQRAEDMEIVQGRRYRNPGEAISALNRAAVRRWFREHLCGTQRECAEALGLSSMAVNRHVAAIRAEWREQKAVDE